MNKELQEMTVRWGRTIDSFMTEVFYRKYFEWGLPTRRFIQVNLETNSVCTRECHYCLFGIRKVSPKYMSPELFFTIIDQLADMRFRGRISLFEINEPLTDKRIYDFTKYTHIKLPDCCQMMATNGDLLTREKLDLLMESGLDLLVINSYDEASRIKNEEHVKYGAGKYPDRVQHCDKSGFTGWVSRAGHIQQYAGEVVRTFCEYPSYILYIKPDGKVLACWNDFDERNVMGDLNKETIRKVWYGKRFEEFRKSISRGKRDVSPLCSRCDHKPDIQYVKWNRTIIRKKHKGTGSRSDEGRAGIHECAHSIKRKYLHRSPDRGA